MSGIGGIARGGFDEVVDGASAGIEALASEAVAEASLVRGGVGPQDRLAVRTQGRTVTTFEGVRLRDPAWAVDKRDHVDRIHAFAERYDTVGTRFLSVLSDINFARGVYARSEVMSLVNDYLAPVDASGQPTTPEWAAYMQACDDGASTLDKARLFFAAHNEALARAEADPGYAAAIASSDPRHVALAEITIRLAEDIDKALQQPGADASALMMEGMAGFFRAHAEAGIMPITGSDLDLVFRASNLNPFESMLDSLRGESADETLMARAMRTQTTIFEHYLHDRLDGVRSFGRRLIARFRD